MVRVWLWTPSTTELTPIIVIIKKFISWEIWDGNNIIIAIITSICRVLYFFVQEMENCGINRYMHGPQFKCIKLKYYRLWGIHSKGKDTVNQASGTRGSILIFIKWVMIFAYIMILNILTYFRRKIQKSNSLILFCLTFKLNECNAIVMVILFWRFYFYSNSF